MHTFSIISKTRLLIFLLYHSNNRKSTSKFDKTKKAVCSIDINSENILLCEYFGLNRTHTRKLIRRKSFGDLHWNT